MNLRNLLIAALAFTPLAVFAAGQLGFAVGNVNADGSCKKQSDFESDFAAITGNTQSTLIRTYSSSDSYGNQCNTPSEVLPAAKNAGVKVLLGMWPDGTDDTIYNKEKAPIVSADVEQYGDTLFGITVGSEGIYRGTYNAGQLTAWIGDMKKTFPNTKIGTADSWSCYTNGSLDNVITSGIDLA